MMASQYEHIHMPPAAVLSTAMLCFLFGANAVAIKISLSGLGTFTAAALRFSVAALAISLWAVATRRSFSVARRHWGEMLALSIFFTAQLSLFYFGMRHTIASRATLLVNLQPFIVLVLAHVFFKDDRISIRKTVSLLMGFAGVAFVFMESSRGQHATLQGDLIILGATFLWGANAIFIKRVTHHFNPFQVVLYPMIFAVPIMAIEGYLWDAAAVSDMNTEVILSLLYQSLVTAAFGFVCWNTLLQKYGAVTLHSFLFVMPISGVLLGGLVLGDPITYKVLIAMVLIVGGMFILHFKQRPQVPLSPPGKPV